MSAASAGWFDWFDDSKVENETYSFNNFTLDLPQNASMYNRSADIYGYYMITYYVSWGAVRDGNNGSIDVSYASGENMVSSLDEYVQNWIDNGAKSEGMYGEWAIINVNGVPYSSGGDSFTGYRLANFQNGSLYILGGDNLTFLKNVADTFKLT